MQFKVKKDDILLPLSNLVRITSKKQSDIQIEKIEDNTIRLSSTNENLILEYNIKVENVTGEGVMVNAKNLYNIVDKLDGEIEFIDGIIKNKRKQIQIGVKSDLTIRIEAIENKETIDIDLNDFKKVIKNRLYACSKNDFQEALKSICIDGNKIVTCDSNVLSMGEIKQPIGNMLITQELANEIIKIFDGDTIKLVDEDKKLIFIDNNKRLTGYKVATLYPKYQQLLPHYSTAKIKLPKDEIIKNLELMQVVAPKEKPVCKFEFKKDKLLMTNTANKYDVIELDIENNGIDITIAFNINYFINVLKNSKGEVEMQVENPLSAAVFTTEEDYNLLMPVSLK